jgi:hypothetical protein
VLQVLTRHAKFRLHSSETDLLSANLSDTLESLKIRTSLEESLMSVNSASTFVSQLETTKIKVGKSGGLPKINLYMMQCPPLNRITLDQHKIDKNNRMNLFCTVWLFNVTSII